LQTCQTMAEYCRATELAVTLLPGIPELVNELWRSDYPLGVVTGNTQEIGWLKLTAAGLRERFRIGAFGDEAASGIRWLLCVQRRDNGEQGESEQLTSHHQFP